MGLERGPLSLVRITEELPEWQSNGSGSRKLKLTAVGIPLFAKVGTNFAKSGGRSVGIVRLRTKATEF
jgi:hypothetical protein